MTVPGNWTLQDTGDLPHYTNVQMPFHGSAAGAARPQPHRRVPPHRSPIPPRLAGRQVVLHVGGAESVHAVYVNGSFAGYGTDSRLPSEYDITDFVRRR